MLKFSRAKSCMLAPGELCLKYIYQPKGRAYCSQHSWYDSSSRILFRESRYNMGEGAHLIRLNSSNYSGILWISYLGSRLRRRRHPRVVGTQNTNYRRQHARITHHRRLSTKNAAPALGAVGHR